MSTRKVFIVDDNQGVRASIMALLDAAGHAARDFESSKAVLDDPALCDAGCLIADIRMPDMDGLTLQDEIRRRNISLPIIIITGHGDVPLAVRAMKAGAVNFLEKPFDGGMLLAAVEEALTAGSRGRNGTTFSKNAKTRIEGLSPREREILQLLVEGAANKVIAHRLGISPRTVEIHRANVMEKMGCRSLSELVRAALVAGVESPG